MNIAEVTDVESFDRWLAERSLSGLWGRERAGDFKPWLWKWDDIHTALVKAGEVIGLDFVNRRDVNLVNPTTGIGRPSKTVSGTLQYLMPGDVARAHRHSAATARWVIEGDEEAYSVVEGEAFPVTEGDLLVAPSMAWHDHFHKGTKPTVWLSSLDNQFTQLTHSFSEGSTSVTSTVPIGLGIRLVRWKTVCAKPRASSSQFSTLTSCHRRTATAGLIRTPR